ncbi:hypothetical protein ABKN59_001316 [Abortiporus biennis]
MNYAKRPLQANASHDKTGCFFWLQEMVPRPILLRHNAWIRKVLAIRHTPLLSSKLQKALVAAAFLIISQVEIIHKERRIIRIHPFLNLSYRNQRP